MASYPIRAKWFGWTGGGTGGAGGSVIEAEETTPGSGFYTVYLDITGGVPLFCAADTDQTNVALGQLRGTTSPRDAVWEGSLTAGQYKASSVPGVKGSTVQATVHFGPDVNGDEWMDTAEAHDFPVTIHFP